MTGNQGVEVRNVLCIVYTVYSDTEGFSIGSDSRAQIEPWHDHRMTLFFTRQR